MKRLAGLFAFAFLALFAAAAAAAPMTFVAVLSGAAESPPNASPGTGTAIVIIDPVAHTMRVVVSFSGLLGMTTASHIHCCTAAPGTGTAMVATQVPTFIDFPLGVTSGTYDHFFIDTNTDPSVWNPNFIAAHGGTAASAEADFFAAMIAGKTYLNVHSTFAPGGEIRGFLVVPEPASLALLGIALAGIAVTRRRRIRAPLA